MTKHEEKNDLNEWKKAVEGLDKIEKVYIPDRKELLNNLTQMKREHKKRLMKEVFVFFITALCLFSLYVMLISAHFTALLWTQGLALLFIPIVLLLDKRKSKKQSGWMKK